MFWTSLTAFGSVLISSRLVRANQLYGTIGFVIGLIFWIYLGAYGALLATELNACGPIACTRGRWFGPPRTRIDRRALRERARTEELFPGQVVDVRFDGPDDASDGPPTSPSSRRRRQSKKPRATASSMRAERQRPRAPLNPRRWAG